MREANVVAHRWAEHTQATLHGAQPSQDHRDVRALECAEGRTGTREIRIGLRRVWLRDTDTNRLKVCDG